MYDYITKKNWQKVRSRSRSNARIIATQLGMTLETYKGRARKYQPDFKVVSNLGALEGKLDVSCKFGWTLTYRFPDLHITDRVTKWLNGNFSTMMFNADFTQCYLVPGSVIRNSTKITRTVSNYVKLQDEIETFYSVDPKLCQLWKKVKIGRKFRWQQMP